MLSIVKSSSSVRQTLNYNEQKLTQEQARFLGSFNYWEDQPQLDDKYLRLVERSQRNERVLKHTAHISLNFHPGDDLTDQKMKIIAAHYLKDIDFADQPALVYRHLDAGHPHLHIVSTNIRPDGTRISNDLRAPYHLRQVCHRLEETHHLTPVTQKYHLEHDYIQILQYGKVPTSTRIENILDNVLEKYAYPDFEHLNAVLKLYNIMADRGGEDSKLRLNRGLYYRALDDEGNRIGAPIKASDFDSHPTLDYLERRFKENQTIIQQQSNRQHITTWLDWHTHKRSQTLSHFTRSLTKERIHIVHDLPRPRNRQTQKLDGHGFFYVDFEHKTIYRDTDLGEDYTALAIFQRLGLDKNLEELVQRQVLHLSHASEAAILNDPDPRQRLRLWMKLTPQHDHWKKAQEKEEQTLRHRQSHRQTQRLRIEL
jgi:hypothetical protein